MDSDGYDAPEFAPGSVWLCGAGPGDAGLLTLLARHGLRHADVIVHDALISAAVLALAGDGARLESMGKRGRRPSARQAEITARLIELAGQGLRVLRLKGGDPFVFGRGPEEAQALKKAAIPFRVVPGVPAGIGGLAYAGIPVTSRGHGGVAIVTGHGPGGGLPTDIDWRALAVAVPSIVFYMAQGNLGEIAERLMAAGRPADEPMAVVAEATQPRQMVIETTLGRCRQDLAGAGIDGPAVVCVGDVVRLRRQLDWWRP